MEIRINNILELNLTNEDVNSFIDVFGTLKNAIHSQQNKVGFKKTGRIDIELSEETVEFIITICETAGILSEAEIQKQEQEENPSV